MADRILASFAVFAVSVGVLWVGAELFVTNAVHLARRFGLSELVVGLTVVALGTSAPEVAVSVDAALVGTGDVAAANVVGSNLFNIGIILGSIATAVGVRSSQRMVRRDGVVLVASTALMLLVFLDRRLTRLEGALLLFFFITYLLLLFLRPGEDGVDGGNGTATRWTPVLLLLGLAVIIGGAHFLVESAVSIARTVGLSEWVIGETIVAVGTSTPEIVASVAAARKGMGDIAAGNLIGSNIFNALLVLGVASVLAPFRVVDTAVGTTTWLLGLSILAAVLLGSRGRLGRLEGAVLVLLNLIRWVLDLL